MAACQLIETCIFFNDKMSNMPATADVFKNRYCRGDAHSCARYRVFEKLGRTSVPPDLYPNEHDRADIVLGLTE